MTQKPVELKPGASPLNESIVDAIEQQQFPLLPFEIQSLQIRWEEFAEKQKELGAIMREAMSESSETWHDNAPADAVMNDSKTLTTRALAVARLLGHSHELEYPKGSQPVTLGSIVGIQFRGDPEVENYLLTGAVREIPEQIAGNLPSETEAVTLSSPMGEALFGSSIGEDVSYYANSREIAVKVVQVLQLGDIIEPQISHS